jgi:hypothetical protein
VKEFLPETIEDSRVELEYLVPDFYTADIYLPGLNTLLDVHGPSHFNGLQKMEKKDLTKRRVFQKLGYKSAMVRGMQFLQAYDKERRWNIIKFSLTSAK